MCWEAVKRLFHPKPIIPPEPPLALPHPEEPADMTATVNTVSIQAVKAAWMAEWEVPDEAARFWNTVHITVAEHLEYDQYPAYSYSKLRQLYFHPPYFNKGTLAHEMAHIVYALLDGAALTAFSIAYRRLVVEDKLVAYLWKVKAPAMYDMQETHAEIYRYLGEKMPVSLRRFYPNLF